MSENRQLQIKTCVPKKKKQRKKLKIITILHHVGIDLVKILGTNKIGQFKIQ